MPLWIDEYRPRTFQEIDFNLNTSRNIQNLVKKGDFPHLMFHGPSGSGKKTRVLCLLRELYGDGALNMRMERMSFTTASNKKLEIQTIGSNYHIEINPADVGIYDRVVVMDLIKQVAQTHQINSAGQREFKVIVLTGVDSLTMEAQHALRRTMEKYMSTCRLVLVTQSLSKVIDAIHSRCLLIRCPAPKLDEIEKILKSIADKEEIKVADELLSKIAKKSNRNLRRAILMLETSYALSKNKFELDAKSEVVEPDWLKHLKDIAAKIVDNQTIATLQGIRNHLYEQIIHGITPHIIFEGLLKHIISKTDVHLAARVLELASLYENRLSHGSKPIFHVEAFVAEVMNIFKQFFEENKMEF